MSEYVFVIDELDIGINGSTAQEETGTNSLLSLSTNNYELVNNANLNHSNNLINEIDVPCNIVISNARSLNVTNTPPLDLNVIASKKFDVQQLNETPTSTSTIVRIWPQFRWHCFLCTFSSEYYKFLINHQRYCHNIDNDDEIHYFCNDCGNVIHKYSQFLNHVRCMHYPHLKLSCDICGRWYERKTIIQHRELFHANHEDIRPKVVHCEECELVFSTREEVDTHVTNNHRQCKVCNMTFSSKKEYNTHLKEEENKHKEKTKSCAHCDEKFINPDEFLVHMEMHKPAERYKCFRCKMRFSLKTEYLKHMKIHQKRIELRKNKEQYLTTVDKNIGPINPVKCFVCDVIFLQQTEYDFHMKTHHPAEPLELDQEQSVEELISAYTIETHHPVQPHVLTQQISKETPSAVKFYLPQKRPKKTCKECGQTFSKKHTKFACLRHSFAFRFPIKKTAKIL